MTRYEIAFSGQLVEGAPLASVQANLARLFQADAQRIAQLFSGRRVVIKNNLDEAGAEKYRLTLERAGAVVEVLAMLVEEVELTPCCALLGDDIECPRADRDDVPLGCVVVAPAARLGR